MTSLGWSFFVDVWPRFEFLDAITSWLCLTGVSHQAGRLQEGRGVVWMLRASSGRMDMVVEGVGACLCTRQVAVVCLLPNFVPCFVTGLLVPDDADNNTTSAITICLKHSREVAPKNMSLHHQRHHTSQSQSSPSILSVCRRVRTACHVRPGQYRFFCEAQQKYIESLILVCISKVESIYRGTNRRVARVWYRYVP